jgi:hypothetical protein
MESITVMHISSDGNEDRDKGSYTPSLLDLVACSKQSEVQFL